MWIFHCSLLGNYVDATAHYLDTILDTTAHYLDTLAHLLCLALCRL